MASTPSGSALTAVLRCRRNVWARNTPSTRTPPAAAYGWGRAPAAAAAAYGTERAPAERARFRRGERVAGFVCPADGAIAPLNTVEAYYNCHSQVKELTGTHTRPKPEQD